MGLDKPSVLRIKVDNCAKRVFGTGTVKMPYASGGLAGRKGSWPEGRCKQPGTGMSGGAPYMSKAERGAITRLGEIEKARFLRTKDMRFLECAIELMLTDYHPDEVAAILRKQAKIVEEYG